MHDLVIRNGTIVDGTGRAALHGRRRDRRRHRSSAVGEVAERGRREIDARGSARHARLGRRAHPLRRPGDLGPGARAVELARRDHAGDGQLRRRLRAGAARPGGLPDRADGGRRGHPRHRAARGHRLALGVVPRVPRRARAHAARARRRGAGAALRDPRLRARRARARPRAQRRRDRRDGAPHARGAARRRGRLLAPRARSCIARVHGLVPGTHSKPEELLAHRPRARRGRPRRVRDGRPTCRARSRISRGCASSAATTGRVDHLRAGADADPAAAPGARRWRASTSWRRAACASCRRCRAGRPACSSACRARSIRSSPIRPIATSSPICRSRSASRACAIPALRARLLAEEPATRQPDRARR